VRAGGGGPAPGKVAGWELGDEVLERPAVAEQPEVRERAGRQESAQQVERLRTRRGLPRPLGLVGLDWKALADGVGQRLQQAAERLEERVRRRLIVGVGELR